MFNTRAAETPRRPKTDRDDTARIVAIAAEAGMQIGLAPADVHRLSRLMEAKVRENLGGAELVIAKARRIDKVRRIAELWREGLPATVVAKRVGVSDRYVRLIVQRLRQVGGPN